MAGSPDEERGPHRWAPLDADPGADREAPPAVVGSRPLPPGGVHGPPPGWPPPPGGYRGPVLPKAGDARTGPLPLHPMSVGDVLDGAFKLLKANARTIVIVAGAVVVPMQLASAFLLREQLSPGLLNVLRDPTLAESSEAVDFAAFGSTAMTGLLGLLSAPLIAGAVSLVVAASYLGEATTAGAALRATLRRLVPLLVATILVFLAQVGGALLCLVPGVIAFALFSAVTPAIVIEDVGPIQGMRRSWRLLRPRFWGVLGIALLARLIAGVLGNLLGGLPAAIGTIFGGTFAWLFLAAGGVLSELVAAPVVAIVATLLYFDGRIRNEGLDLQVMAMDLERGARHQ